MTTQDLIKQILPEKKELPTWHDPYNTTDAMSEAFNECHDLATQSLTKAFADGVICELPSIDELDDWLYVLSHSETGDAVSKYDFSLYKDRKLVAQSIHELLRKQNNNRAN